MKKVLLVSLAVIIFSCNNSESIKKQESKEPQSILLHASFLYEDIRLQVSNGDNFAYKKSLLVLNKKYNYPGFNLGAGKDTVINMTEFCDDDGNRFGIDQKPLSISIIDKLDNGDMGTCESVIERYK